MKLSRRHLLKFLGAGAVSAAVSSQFPTMFTSHAAETGGYKALVCVFLLGGSDGYDIILPYDNASYSRFANARKSLLNLQGAARSRSSLLSIAPVNSTEFGSRQFALPPEMPRIKQLFDQGQAAIVGNVGPLLEPLNRQQYVDQTARLPSHLYSHNSQQATWRSGQSDAPKFGWGGLFADAVLSSGSKSGSSFTTISTTEAGAFLTGQRAFPFQINSGEAARYELLDRLDQTNLSASQRALLEKVQTIVSADEFSSQHIIERDMANIIGRGFDANAEFRDAIEAAQSVGSFGSDDLSQQLASVAKTIAVRGRLLANRQVFYVAQGGFDTHSGQADGLSALLRNVDNAIASFHGAMTELGLQNDVVTFTASDFGRTLTANGDGTDHGWGNHHFVVGGGVNGRRIIGQIPEAGLGHDLDAGRGRLIPTHSVEQYAGALGRWFGLNDSELASALPGLRNFNGGIMPIFA